MIVREKRAFPDNSFSADMWIVRCGGKFLEYFMPLPRKFSITESAFIYGKSVWKRGRFPIPCRGFSKPRDHVKSAKFVLRGILQPAKNIPQLNLHPTFGSSAVQCPIIQQNRNAGAPIFIAQLTTLSTFYFLPLNRRNKLTPATYYIWAIFMRSDDLTWRWELLMMRFCYRILLDDSASKKGSTNRIEGSQDNNKCINITQPSSVIPVIYQIE